MNPLGFHKMLGIAQLAASQEGLNSMSEYKALRLGGWLGIWKDMFI
jgi:hypothetical protein